jgi:hypothetical protein
MILTDDTALISISHQGEGDMEKIFNDALAEAARATRAQGYRYFSIIDTADTSERGVKIRQGVPVHIQDTPGFARGGSPLSSNFISGSSYRTPDRRIPYVRLGLDITIRMYRDGDVNPANPGVWNSDIVQGGK